MEKGNKQIQDDRLREQIARAQATALTREELEKVLFEEAELTNLFLRGMINKEELKSKLKALNRHAGVVKTDDPKEFRRFLELICPYEEVVQKFIDDEMPHYDQAIKQGLKPILRLQFYKMEDGTWGLRPQTEVTYPDKLSDESFREAHRKTIAAPEEENLSRLDRKGLGLT